ncbi:MAG: N-(5'-phosphoribosyl)anthranilate isomerase [Siphonobacter sp.]
MALRTLVKISNITNLSDARYCAGMGVEWLGFSMDDIALDRFTEIRSWLAGVSIVGETNSRDLDTIEQLTTTYQPDILQISHPEILVAVKKLGLPVILKLDLAEGLPTALPETEYYLIDHSDPFAHLDAPTMGYIDQFAFQHPTLLGFGITEFNVLEALEQLPVKGIALTGGEETRPGFTEFGEMMDILERIEEE